MVWGGFTGKDGLCSGSISEWFQAPWWKCSWCKNTDGFGLQVGNKWKNLYKLFTELSHGQVQFCCSAEQGKATETCCRDDIVVTGTIVTAAFTSTWGGSSWTTKCSSYSRYRKVFLKKKVFEARENYGVSTGRKKRQKKNKRRENPFKAADRYVWVHVAKISWFFSCIKGYCTHKKPWRKMGKSALSATSRRKSPSQQLSISFQDQSCQSGSTGGCPSVCPSICLSCRTMPHPNTVLLPIAAGSRVGNKKGCALLPAARFE